MDPTNPSNVEREFEEGRNDATGTIEPPPEEATDAPPEEWGGE